MLRLPHQLILLSYASTAAAFLLDSSRNSRHRTERNLIPIAPLSEDLSFTSSRYQIHQDEEAETIGFYVPESDDLSELSEFIVTAFGADAINLSQDFSAAERFFLQPITGILNGYGYISAYTEVLAGLNQRLKSRFRKVSVDAPDLQGLAPDEQVRRAANSSLLFVVANDEGKEGSQIIASVELRLELTDGKIPFSIPFLDQAERRFAQWIGWQKAPSTDLQPYLSSLCVDEAYRKRGIGKALVHCCEDVARLCWGLDRLYLHVDPANTAAVQLYETEGYLQVNDTRWNPFWAGPAAEIGYYVKPLS